MAFSLHPIGVIHTPFAEKFGVPRQASLAPAATATLELLPPYNRPESVLGLEGFSHLWLIFVFHQTLAAGWRPTVRPPRLGGQRHCGVFASRAPYRPNGLGLSAVRLVEVDTTDGVRLRLAGVDLLDQTPVVDIKPYLPYADKLEASGGYAQQPPSRQPVWFSPAAQQVCDEYRRQRGVDLAQLVVEVIGLDPRPGYDRTSPRRFALRLLDVDVRWQATERLGVAGFEICDIVPLA